MKPRICEILDVEVGERFCIKGFFEEKVTFFIRNDGTFYTRPYNCLGSSYALLKALEHPENIIRKIKWTEQHIKDAKAIKYIFPDAEYVIKNYYGDDELTLFFPKENTQKIFNNKLFKNIPEGVLIDLNKIIGDKK